MADPPRDGTELMRAFLPASPFAARVGLVLEDAGDGEAVLLMPWDPVLATVGDVVHGGAISTLADSAIMAAAWAGVPLPGRLRGATISLSVTFADTARAEDLRAYARVVRRGAALCHCEADVRGADGRTVARALGVYKLG